MSHRGRLASLFSGRLSSLPGAVEEAHARSRPGAYRADH